MGVREDSVCVGGGGIKKGGRERRSVWREKVRGREGKRSVEQLPTTSLLKALEMGFHMAETVSTERDTTIGEAVILAISSNSPIFKEKSREQGSTT